MTQASVISYRHQESESFHKSKLELPSTNTKNETEVTALLTVSPVK